jgi:hypothetical protein
MCPPRNARTLPLYALRLQCGSAGRLHCADLASQTAAHKAMLELLDGYFEHTPTPDECADLEHTLANTLSDHIKEYDVGMMDTVKKLMDRLHNHEDNY